MASRKKNRSSLIARRAKKKNPFLFIVFFFLLLFVSVFFLVSKTNIINTVFQSSQSIDQATISTKSSGATYHDVLNATQNKPFFLVRLWTLLLNFFLGVFNGNPNGPPITPSPTLAQNPTPTLGIITPGLCNFIGAGIPSPGTVGGLPCVTFAPTIPPPTPTRAAPTATPAPTSLPVVTPTPTPSTIHHYNSSNWAGYAFDIPFGTTNAQITSTWINSTVSCAGSAYFGTASPWVGLGGWQDQDPDIAQLGTDLHCQNGAPQYRAWTEGYPAGTVFLNNPVHAGDKMTASVTFQGIGNFSTTITDVTAGWSVNTPIPLPGDTPQTGEVILESYVDSPVVPPFQPPVQFTNNQFSVGGSAMQNISAGQNLSNVDITNNGILEVQTSGLSGGTFTETWLHN